MFRIEPSNHVDAAEEEKKAQKAVWENVALFCITVAIIKAGLHFDFWYYHSSKC
jgi:hypothetical protein